MTQRMFPALDDEPGSRQLSMMMLTSRTCGMLGCAATSPGEPDWVQLWAVRQASLVHANGSHSNECAVKSLACQTDYKTQLRAGTFGRVCQPSMEL